MKKTEFTIGMLALILFGISVSLAVDKKGGSRGNLQKGYSFAAGGPFSTLVNINRISMWISYDGASARNPTTTNAGVTYPRGTSQTIYGDGFLWGGLVHDGGSQILRMNGGTYQQGIVGGRIISKGVSEDASDPTIRIYRIRRDYETADLTQDASELGSDVGTVRQQYKTDWLQWPWKKGAPYYDRNHNGVYDPDPDGKYDPTKDEPGYADADQVVWFVTNDLNAAQSRSFQGSDPIGLEVQTTLWAYARTDQLGNVIFKQFKFIYKGTAGGSSTSRIDSMYVGQWADPDLGDYSDDFEGCDTNRVVFGGLGKTTSLGFVYNSTTLDRNYHAFNLAPPSMGYDFFAGPLVASPGDSAVFDLSYRHGYRNMQMTSWIYFAASGTYSDPEFNYVGAGQWYNLFRGLTPVDGTPFYFTQAGGNQDTTEFWLSGDPVAGTGNLDGHIDAPGDRRMMLSSGPFSMVLGDTQEVVVAMIGGLGSDRLSSVSVLRFNDLSAQFAYDNLFQLPKAPPAPRLRIGELDKKLVLNWGYDSSAVALTENDNSKGYAFEGYNVYQLPNATATVDQGVKLATFDIANDVTTILDPVFDAASGQILSRPVQIGPNLGIKRYLLVTDDKLRERPLVNGQSYYFAVTAYNNYSGTGAVPIHSLENPLSIVRAIPQSNDPGVRYHSKFEDTIAIPHTQGIADAEGVVRILDPSKLTGHNYEVQISVTDSVTIDFEGSPLKLPNPTWAVVDKTLNKVLLSRQTIYNFDPADPIVDNALQVGLSGAPFWTAGKEISAQTYTPDANFNWTGIDNGLAFFGGGLDVAYNFLGSTLRPFEVTKSVEIRFNSADGQNAYDYKRTLSGGSGGAPYSGFYPQPFKVFDVTDPDHPRQIDFAFMERDGQPTEDNIWAPGPDPTGNNREYWFIIDEDYTPTAKADYAGTALGDQIAAKPALYAGWYVLTDPSKAPYNDGDVWKIKATNLITANDRWAFTTAGKNADVSAAKAKQDVNAINVFPNPYYGFNRVEADRFNRFVTFNHLPPGDWRIRIVSLNGSIVRYIDPNSQNQNAVRQFATWDLNNQNGLPVASGIYVAYVEMPSLGVTKTLKVVIIQEKQVLDYY